MWHVYIPKFAKNLVKFSAFSVPYRIHEMMIISPRRCNVSTMPGEKPQSLPSNL